MRKFAKRSTLAIVTVATLSGCANSAQQSAAGCQLPTAKGTTTFAQGSTPEVSNKSGTLTVLVSEGTRRSPALSDAAVTLHGDTNVLILSEPVRSGQTDAHGAAHWDSVAAGRYLLVVRRAGYESLRRVLSLRAGYVDTVVVQLRTEPHC